MKYTPDELLALCQKDQEEFKKIMRAMIDDVIDNAREGNRDNLRRKQWKLDQELSKIKDPIAQMNKMVSIFWEGVHEFVEVAKDAGFGSEIPEEIEPELNVPEEKESNVVDFNLKNQ